jgi:hypothetical protein
MQLATLLDLNQIKEDNIKVDINEIGRKYVG